MGSAIDPNRERAVPPAGGQGRAGLPVRLLQAAGWGSLAVAAVAHGLRLDVLAPLTLVPFLFWAAAGATGFALVFAACRRGQRSRRTARIGLAAWAVAVLLLADEVPMLLRAARDRPEPGPPSEAGGTRPLRLASLNCRGRSAEAAEAVVAYAPDIVFFQEAPSYANLRRIAIQIFGDEAQVLSGWDTAIIARGTRLEVRSRGQRNWLLADLTRSDGRMIRLLNLHLNPAETDLRLWRPQTWRGHLTNRRDRRELLAQSLAALAEAEQRTGRRLPTIVAGDFNAPPSDGSLRLMEGRFTDTARASGSGWCNTFSDSLPVVRIDQIWVGDEFLPVRHAAMATRRSDHRMVVCDLVPVALTEP